MERSAAVGEGGRGAALLSPLPALALRQCDSMGRPPP